MKNILNNEENLELFNKKGKKVYGFYKDSDGFSYERTYDSNGSVLTYKNSAGYSYEYTYDSNGKELTFKDSDGVKRSFDIPEYTMEELAAKLGNFKIKNNMKEEALEEAAESRFGTDMDSIRGSAVYDLNTDLKRGFIEGVKSDAAKDYWYAKWQAERMYSEEDLREAFRQGMENMDYSEIYGLNSELTEQDWFEQFKKK